MRRIPKNAEKNLQSGFSACGQSVFCHRIYKLFVICRMKTAECGQRRAENQGYHLD